MIRATAVALVLAFDMAAPPALAEDGPSLPDPIMTPGAVDASATLTVICTQTTRKRRHVSAPEKAAVLAAYNIPASQSVYYEIDHLIPLAIGGSNVVANLWPQPWVEADQKDLLEVALQRQVCAGLVDQAQAQREIADDWVAAYRRHVDAAIIAVAPDVRAAPTPASTPPRRSLTERLKADVRRLSRSWIFGSE